MSRRIWSVLLLAALVAACLHLTTGLTQTGDYGVPECATCDNAGAAVNALAAGHVGAFFSLQPVMGSLSLLIRAPLVALSSGDLLQYRLGALALLLLVAGMALWLARELDRRGVSRLQQALLLGVVMLNPLMSNAVGYGHPEEPFAAALCVLAVVLAADRRPLVAGVALGLALATKQWAILAIAPVLLATPQGRRRLLLGAAGTAALFSLPMLIGDPSRYLHIVTSYSGASGAYMTPSNFWWPFGHALHPVIDGLPTTRYELPSALTGISHPLLFALCATLLVVWWRTARRPGARPALELLALLFLIRCQLDTLTYGYHHLPMLFCLATAETLRGRRLPWVSLAVSAATWSMAHLIAGHAGLNGLFVAYMCWSVPLVAYLLVTVFELPVPRVMLPRRTAQAMRASGATSPVHPVS